MIRLRGEGDATGKKSLRATSRKNGEHAPRVDARHRGGKVALAGWVTSGLGREQLGDHVLDQDILVMSAKGSVLRITIDRFCSVIATSLEI